MMSESNNSTNTTSHSSVNDKQTMQDRGHESGKVSSNDMHQERYGMTFYIQNQHHHH